MTTRRQFIRGAVAVAVSAAIPGSEYTYRTYGTAEYWGTSIATMLEPAQRGLSQRYARMLARSMRQTTEIVAANVLNGAFGGSTYE